MKCGSLAIDLCHPQLGRKSPKQRTALAAFCQGAMPAELSQ